PLGKRDRVPTRYLATINLLIGFPLKVDPFPVMRPAGYQHTPNVADQLARQSFHDVDDVHLPMTRMPGTEGNFPAIGGPTGPAYIGTLCIREFRQIRSVYIAHPDLCSPLTTGRKGDMLPIWRVLRIILAACGANDIHRGSFWMEQVPAPNSDALERMDDKGEF